MAGYSAVHFQMYVSWVKYNKNYLLLIILLQHRFEVAVFSDTISSMAKRLYCGLLLILFWISAGVASEYPEKIILNSQEKAFLKDHPRIILGTDRSWRPNVIVDKNGSITGYDADVLSLINQVSGSHFVLKAGSWQKMQEAVRQRYIDGLSSGAPIASRKSYVNFSDVYSVMNKMVIVANDNPAHIYTLDDLHGKTIAIHRGNLADEATAKLFSQSNIIRYDTVEDVLKAVVSGKADATFANVSTLSLANELGMPYFKKVALLPHKLELVFSIRNDWPEAVSIINKALKVIGSEKLKALQHKWFWQEGALPLLPEEVNLSYEQKIFLSSKKEIRYCVDPDWMPLEAIRHGKTEGMVSDLIPIFAKRIGVPFRLIDKESWDDALLALKEGECDIVTMMMPTRMRSELYYFTTPYLQFPIVVATTYDKSFISEIGKLSNKKIGVVRNYVFKELLEREYPNIEFMEVLSVKEGLEAVRDGKLFGVIDNLYVLGYHIQKYFPAQLKISGKSGEKLQLSIAMNKNQPELLPIMQKLVDSLEPEMLEKVTAQWLSVTYTEGADRSFLWKILSIVLVLSLFLLYRQYILHQYNRQLQEEVERQVEELRKKDEILVSKLRMAAMGEMLSMIAHQWRQPLSVISNTLMAIDLKMKMGKYDLENEEGKKEFFIFMESKHKQINQYLSYLSHTIDDFKNFFRPDKKKEAVSVTEPLDRALSLVEQSFKESGIVVEKEYNTERKVDIVSNEIMQVVLNMLKNSEYNFKEKNIKTPRIYIYTEEKEDEVHIVLCDNGGGISESIISKIFDPYYSTKDEINGTGLGLYMSKMMMEEHHGGVLSVANTEDGACFTMVFKLTGEDQK